MTADIINLKQARKRRQRTDKDLRAAENRVKFGRSKLERQQATESADIEVRRLDGHLRNDSPNNQTPGPDGEKT